MGYYGHVARCPDEWWAKFLLDAELAGGAKKGKAENWRKQMEKTLTEAVDADANFSREGDKEVFKNIFDSIRQKRAGAVLS